MPVRSSEKSRRARAGQVAQRRATRRHSGARRVRPAQGEGRRNQKAREPSAAGAIRIIDFVRNTPRATSCQEKSDTESDFSFSLIFFPFFAPFLSPLRAFA
jgi:hypothetical protein